MSFLDQLGAKVVFAFWLGVVVLAVTLLMLLVILAMRQVMLRKERNHQRAATAWHTILVLAQAGTPVEVPALPRRDVTGFLEVWNQLHAARTGGSADRLPGVAD